MTLSITKKKKKGRDQKTPGTEKKRKKNNPHMYVAFTVVVMAKPDRFLGFGGRRRDLHRALRRNEGRFPITNSPPPLPNICRRLLLIGILRGNAASLLLLASGETNIVHSGETGESTPPRPPPPPSPWPPLGLPSASPPQ